MTTLLASNRFDLSKHEYPRSFHDAKAARAGAALRKHLGDSDEERAAYASGLVGGAVDMLGQFLNKPHMTIGDHNRASTRGQKNAVSMTESVASSNSLKPAFEYNVEFDRRDLNAVREELRGTHGYVRNTSMRLQEGTPGWANSDDTDLPPASNDAEGSIAAKLVQGSTQQTPKGSGRDWWLQQMRDEEPVSLHPLLGGGEISKALKFGAFGGSSFPSADQCKQIVQKHMMTQLRRRRYRGFGLPPLDQQDKLIKEERSFLQTLVRNFVSDVKGTKDLAKMDDTSDAKAAAAGRAVRKSISEKKYKLASQLFLHKLQRHLDALEVMLCTGGAPIQINLVREVRGKDKKWTNKQEKHYMFFPSTMMRLKRPGGGERVTRPSLTGAPGWVKDFTYVIHKDKPVCNNCHLASSGATRTGQVFADLLKDVNDWAVQPMSAEDAQKGKKREDVDRWLAVFDNPGKLNGELKMSLKLYGHALHKSEQIDLARVRDTVVNVAKAVDTNVPYLKVVEVLAAGIAFLRNNADDEKQQERFNKLIVDPQVTFGAMRALTEEVPDVTPSVLNAMHDLAWGYNAVGVRAFNNYSQLLQHLDGAVSSLQGDLSGDDNKDAIKSIDAGCKSYAKFDAAAFHDPKPPKNVTPGTHCSGLYDQLLPFVHGVTYHPAAILMQRAIIATSTHLLADKDTDSFLSDRSWDDHMSDALDSRSSFAGSSGAAARAALSGQLQTVVQAIKARKDDESLKVAEAIDSYRGWLSSGRQAPTKPSAASNNFVLGITAALTVVASALMLA
ncbi:MAG: hypothetical protein MHM6MM_003995 [Cercozoa sp. M6MM]